MMFSKLRRIMVLLTALVCIALALICESGAAASLNRVPQSGDDDASSSPEAYFENNAFTITSQFASHLPLVILEASDDDIVPDESNAAVLRVVDSGVNNRADSTPAYSTGALLKIIQHDEDEPREKEDYMITLQGENGAAVSASLLGMGKRNTWVLLGGMYDKSLLRNYLGYSLMAKFMKDAPEFRFCEVLRYEAGQYRYEGVYLLIEGGGDDAVMLRRSEDRWEKEFQVMVNNGYMGAFLLESFLERNDAKVADAGNALDTIGAMFYSADTNYFLQYSRVVDVDAFISHLIVNELMGNYAEMDTGMYLYSTQTGKISPGPIWNFERSLDNEQAKAFDLTRLEYQNAPFFQFLTWDSAFVDALLGMSKKHGVAIDSDELRVLIDDAVAELGSAQARDWYRWRAVYFAPENALEPYLHPDPDEEPEEAENEADDVRWSAGAVRYIRLRVDEPTYYAAPDSPARVRQLDTYEQEVIKLKYLLEQRPPYVRSALLPLRYQRNLMGKEDSYASNSLFAVLFFIVHGASIHFARKGIIR